MTTFLKYFPNLTDEQQTQFAQLKPLYTEWNEKINVISRKDIDNIELHHVLHALAITKVQAFKDGAKILDLGTGGGFPGIPLAIMYPSVSFTLVDSTAKKIRVVTEVATALGLKNVDARHIRVEELKTERFDFVVTRAVAQLDQLYRWSQRLIAKKHQHALPNGILALKGGNIREEIQAMGKGFYTEIRPIPKMFDEPYFAEKAVVYVQG
ncbi:MAG: 16S rRNA (guanine(527)-N(7))-methyltransferase RsmG [Saprospiraceae bacterium]|nr:16S rRNA (guanine(527)-N(7))-methyltransferase RsmG [Saprospiraceae bacterium]